MNQFYSISVTVIDVILVLGNSDCTLLITVNGYGYDARNMLVYVVKRSVMRVMYMFLPLRS